MVRCDDYGSKVSMTIEISVGYEPSEDELVIKYYYR